MNGRDLFCAVFEFDLCEYGISKTCQIMLLGVSYSCLNFKVRNEFFADPSGMFSMFERLVEKMMRGGKITSDDGYLGKYLDVICPQYVSRYQEIVSGAFNREVDGLDVLAHCLMQEIGVEDAEPSAARAYLSILIDNEHLPVKAQLNESELLTLRELLFCYFGGNTEEINARGSQVLSLIEKKFSSGEFSQAKILLQIFETNVETRQNNERNLYYEEMIMRLENIQPRSKSISQNIISTALQSNATDAEVLRAFSACEQQAGIRFCLYLRDSREYEKWETSLSSLNADARSYLLDYIPIVRWRRLGTLDEPLLSQFGRHVTVEMLKRHVQQKLRMCYFILLASGNTGFEWFIFAFTKWSKEHFDVDVCEVFPMLHRSGVMEGMCLQDALDAVTDKFYGSSISAFSIQQETLEQAYRGALKYIFQTDMGVIPSGHYNFGDFILDGILPFEYADPLFAYRLHVMM